jgi:hypothetical protein
MKIFTKNIADFFIRLIANKKGEYNFTIYEYDRNLITEEAPYVIVTDEDDALKAEVTELVSKNVKELSYHTKSNYAYGTGYGSTYTGDQFWEFEEKSGHFIKKGAKAAEKDGEKKPIGLLHGGAQRWGVGGGYDYFE